MFLFLISLIPGAHCPEPAAEFSPYSGLQEIPLVAIHRASPSFRLVSWITLCTLSPVPFNTSVCSIATSNLEGALTGPV